MSRGRFAFAISFTAASISRATGRRPVQIPHALLQEVIGVVERFALHILRHGKADCARLGRVREHTHCVDRRRHELLGAGDAVPIFAHGAERVVGSGLIAARLLNLLEHRVRLAAGKGIARQEQQRDTVGRGRAGGGDHIQRAGADGGGAGNNFAPAVLLCIGHGGVRHALLVVALVIGEAVAALLERLPDADHAAVAENAEHAVYKFLLPPVEADVLVIEKFHKGLRHG